MFKHENWVEIVAFAIDTGARWMDLTDQHPDGDLTTAAIARAISEQYKDGVEILTAILIVKMAARINNVPASLDVKMFADRWCALFGDGALTGFNKGSNGRG